MNAAPNGHEFDPRRLSIEDLNDPQRAEEVLTHWDELEPALLTVIETHPQHGPRLAMLRRADRWLHRKAPATRPAGLCPSSEALYDFGRGPGFAPLTSAQRLEIERHLKSCRECENLVETLAASPPVPLETGSRGMSREGAPEEVPDAGPDLGVGERRDGASGLPEAAPTWARPAAHPRLRALPRLVPLAVAASLILALGLWIAFSPSGSEPLGFPQAPLLRGSSGGPLFFPRDRVLHATPEARAAFAALDGRILFEIEPRADATNYRVDVARHGDDAFAADEESLLKLSGSSSTIQATMELAPGQYTWTARAVVRGLDQVLGARDFAVVDDLEVCKELVGLASRDEHASPDGTGRSLAAVRLLHEHGYIEEARAIARGMPPTHERDVYLSQVPGR
jgi:hypothetical protein